MVGATVVDVVVAVVAWEVNGAVDVVASDAAGGAVVVSVELDVQAEPRRNTTAVARSVRFIVRLRVVADQACDDTDLGGEREGPYLPTTRLELAFLAAVLAENQEVAEIPMDVHTGATERGAPDDVLELPPASRALFTDC